MSAAIASAVPSPCGTTPSMDTLNGSTGAGNCYIPATATRPTSVQAASTTTDGTGKWTVTWSKAFQSATPFVKAEPLNASSAAPISCNVSATTSTTASGQCWTGATTITLPGIALNLLNLNLNINGSSAANIVVRVAGRDLTQ
jgi:hypothetical protein